MSNGNNKRELTDAEKYIRAMHKAKANIAVVDLSGKGEHTFIEDGLLTAFDDVIVVQEGIKSKYDMYDNTYTIQPDLMQDKVVDARSVIIDNVTTPEVIRNVTINSKDSMYDCSYVLACNADCITDFTGMISKCLGDKTYPKTDWFLNFDGSNLFDLIVEIDNVSSEETEPPRYEVVVVHILRWNDYTEEEELIHAIWLNRSNNKYYCCEFPSRNDMQARYRVSDNANRELLLDSFKKLFLNFEERN